MSNRNVSIKDVARQSGVSIATVSNVLNDRCNVSEELRMRVLQAVDELGYVANPFARSMRNMKTSTVGVVILDFNCIFFAPLLKGIQNVMSKREYNVITYDTNYNGELEKKYVRIMRNNLVDGLILAGISNGKDKGFYSELNSISGKKNIPIVSIESDLSSLGIDSVFVDNREAAYTATNHLIEVGCRRIAHIKAPKDTYSENARLGGYRRALKEAGLSPNPALELQGDFSPISGYNAIHAAIRSGLQFDGIFAANDQMAVGAIRALGNAGKRIPEDVKIVGFDNTFIASIVNPALTTINVPKYEMGVIAAQQLLARIDRPDGTPAAIRMDYELMIRHSTMLSAQTKWDMEYW